MANDTQVYRCSRRLPLYLFVLAIIFSAGPFLPNDRQVTALGYALMGIIVIAVVVAGAFAWRYGIRVSGATIEAGAFNRKSYALDKATSISVQMIKTGKVAVVRFSDGQILRFDRNLIGFDDLPSLISRRTSLPVTKPAWDP